MVHVKASHSLTCHPHIYPKKRMSHPAFTPSQRASWYCK